MTEVTDGGEQVTLVVRAVGTHYRNANADAYHTLPDQPAAICYTIGPDTAGDPRAESATATPSRIGAARLKQQRL